MKKILFLICSLMFIQCSVSKKISSIDENATFRLDTLTLTDSSRNRAIPIAIYQPKEGEKFNDIPIVLSHGYGKNQGGDYLYAYTYLTEFLASKGYFVVSIQHELPTDELLAMTGELKQTRRPNWERGAQNIYFVLQELQARYPKLRYDQLALIGHSNGGDMTALFAHDYPKLVSKLITMDNRRMELPRTTHPKIYTLRSSDHPADPNVLPTDEEARKYGIVIDFTAINHSDMDNDANNIERHYLTTKILSYLMD